MANAEVIQVMASLINMFLLGFDDMDSVYASPEDFKSLKNRDRLRGLHLLEYFVTRCHEIGVSIHSSIASSL